MGTSFAAIVGGLGGGLVILFIIILFLCFLKSQCKELSNKNSDSGSSAPSAVGNTIYYLKSLGKERFNLFYYTFQLISYSEVLQLK